MLLLFLQTAWTANTISLLRPISRDLLPPQLVQKVISRIQQQSPAESEHSRTRASRKLSSTSSRFALNLGIVVVAFYPRAITTSPETIKSAPIIFGTVRSSCSTKQASNTATTTLPLSIRATVETSPSLIAL